MVLEMAVLQVKAQLGDGFLAAFGQAQGLLEGMPGYRGHQLQRCLEKRDQFLLLVAWDKVEDHTEGFRRSPEYQKWKALLHPYYEPFPEVRHYECMYKNSVDGTENI